MSSDSRSDIELTPVTCRQFADTIDGYFPLKNSLNQMMGRQGFESAIVKISFAPIMEIDGLPADAPVPLSVRTARVGLIEDMLLIVTRDEFCGSGVWRWLGESDQDAGFSPMTRLAEPAYLEGVGFSEELSNPEPAFFVSSDLACATTMASALEKVGWSQARVWAWKQQYGVSFDAEQSAVYAGSRVSADLQETGDQSVEKSMRWLFLKLQ